MLDISQRRLVPLVELRHISEGRQGTKLMDQPVRRTSLYIVVRKLEVYQAFGSQDSIFV